MTRQIPVSDLAKADRKKQLHASSTHLKATTISPYNVRTLDNEHKLGKFHQLLLGCAINNIIKFAIKEYHWQTSATAGTHKKTLDSKTWRFDFCSATSKGHGGIGLLMRPKISKLHSSSEKISDRNMLVHFNENSSTTVIVVYAPIEDYPDEDKDYFYKLLHSCTNDIPQYNIKIAAGDFNARIGGDNHKTDPRSVGRYTYHDNTNNNGSRLINYMDACNMRSTNTRFPQLKSRSWTRLHANGTSKAQLDHIIVNGKWRNSIKNAIAYNSVEINSDHRILSFKISISL